MSCTCVQHVSGASTQQVCQAPIKRLLWRAYNKSSRHWVLRFGPAQAGGAQRPRGTAPTSKPITLGGTSTRGTVSPQPGLIRAQRPTRCITTDPTTQSIHWQGSPQRGTQHTSRHLVSTQHTSKGGKVSQPPVRIRMPWATLVTSPRIPVMVTSLGVPLGKGRG